jgi:hypothetical protein
VRQASPRDRRQSNTTAISYFPHPEVITVTGSEQNGMIHAAAIRIIIISSEKEFIRIKAFLGLVSASDSFMTLRKAAITAMLRPSSKIATGTLNGMKIPVRIHSSIYDPAIQRRINRSI